MNDQYVIQWRSMANGRAGRGTKMFSREEAEDLVAELNAEYPEILHEIVQAREDAAAEVPQEDEEPVAG